MAEVTAFVRRFAWARRWSPITDGKAPSEIAANEP